MKHVLVKCRSKIEFLALHEFVNEAPGLKWIRRYNRAEAMRDFVYIGVVGVANKEAEFRLALHYHVLKRNLV